MLQSDLLPALALVVLLLLLRRLVLVVGRGRRFVLWSRLVRIVVAVVVIRIIRGWGRRFVLRLVHRVGSGDAVFLVRRTGGRSALVLRVAGIGRRKRTESAVVGRSLI